MNVFRSTEDFNHIIQIHVSTSKMRIIKEINQNIVLQFIKNVYNYTIYISSNKVIFAA